MTFDLTTLAAELQSNLDHADLDTVFRVTRAGVTEDRSTYAPEVMHVEGEAHPNDVDIMSGDDWAAAYGFTGQYSYHGAVMHASETFSGGMPLGVLTDYTDLADEDSTWRIVLTTVECERTDEDPEPEPAGWICLVLPGCGHDDRERATCGTCDHTWCATCEPTPSARCPREYDHEGEDLHSGEIEADWQDDLIDAARAVVAAWRGGDLAAAVRHLSCTLSDLPD